MVVNVAAVILACGGMQMVDKLGKGQMRPFCWMIMQPFYAASSTLQGTVSG